MVVTTVDFPGQFVTVGAQLAAMLVVFERHFSVIAYLMTVISEVKKTVDSDSGAAG